MISGKKSFYFQVKVNEEENKNKITLEDVLNNEEDFLLAMKEQWEEFVDTYMQQINKTEINPAQY